MSSNDNNSNQNTNDDDQPNAFDVLAAAAAAQRLPEKQFYESDLKALKANLKTAFVFQVLDDAVFNALATKVGATPEQESIRNKVRNKTMSFFPTLSSFKPTFFLPSRPR